MKTVLIAGAIAAAIAVPAVAGAQTTTTTGTGTAWVCRAAGANDTSNATMGTTKLACRQVDTAKMKAAWSNMSAAASKMNASDPGMPAMKKSMSDMEAMLKFMIEPGGNG
jgi:hypothetical protein